MTSVLVGTPAGRVRLGDGVDLTGEPVTAMAGNWAVTAEGLVKRFEDRRVVDGVDMMVPRGAIYGVLGPNGAGKTTTLRMLLGIIEPDGGARTLLGEASPRDAGPFPANRRCRPISRASSRRPSSG